MDYDLVCLSHLRWDFVYQRPQHIMSRFGREHRVFFVEETIFVEGRPSLHVTPRSENVSVLVPRVPPGLATIDLDEIQRELLTDFLERQEIYAPVLWYYTPMALGYSWEWPSRCTVFDCMDELSAFKNAPPLLRLRERELLRRADVVFTGGHSLYEAKRKLHPSVHAFPSSVDIAHFGKARRRQPEPADQIQIPRPRIGFFGVVDERMDLDLLAALADRGSDWQVVVVGPLAGKIALADLPHRRNIHYLGMKSYDELPAYIAGWDVAILPFVRNESTRFISPTKTPEYLAAGRPVVSTSIHDVVHPYGDEGLVLIADTPDDFVAAVEAALTEPGDQRRMAADDFLRDMSWDRTWSQMNELVQNIVSPAAPAQATSSLEATNV